MVKLTRPGSGNDFALSSNSSINLGSSLVVPRTRVADRNNAAETRCNPPLLKATVNHFFFCSGTYLANTVLSVLLHLVCMSFLSSSFSVDSKESLSESSNNAHQQITHPTEVCEMFRALRVSCDLQFGVAVQGIYFWRHRLSHGQIWPQRAERRVSTQKMNLCPHRAFVLQVAAQDTWCKTAKGEQAAWTTEQLGLLALTVTETPKMTSGGGMNTVTRARWESLK